MSAGQTLFLACVDSAYALAVPLAAVLYFRKVRIPRPPVGTFNSRDIVVMMGFVLAIPFLYLALPGAALPVVLGLVFAGGLTVGYQPVVARGLLRWSAILTLLAADVTTRLLLGWDSPVYWLANSCVVGLMVISATNLNVQGGMRLRNVAWFVLLLGVYDLTFATVLPLSQELADAVQGYPFAPSAGLRVGGLGAVIGMGDLLAYSLYTTAAYKAYGRAGLRTALPLVVVFGALVPAVAPPVVDWLTGHTPSLIPAQVCFAPAAFIGFLVLRRRGPERRMRDYLARADARPAPGLVAAVEPAA
ncbi:hypothetical protein NE236_09520 [Actinoallomurus purpureus]|uniref:hypothetical protein n=1 Tax=Actinoallomurus purpureus TaxID=478114 RepID=UPI002092AF7C|nr:hypothetical protein [Actinoallomurus purpureus]MCO6005223.1 hypothetical protein [Actinoallomurus purpureus]